MTEQSDIIARVALVGLGRVGGQFLERLLEMRDKGILISCAAEPGATPGRAQAESAGIPLHDIDEIVAFDEAIDVIFDLTGSKAVRQQLRTALQARGNEHTVLAPEIIARVLWASMSTETLAQVHDNAGY
ncbi:MAG: homoserine dehydrogenase [Halothiobacillaceae bacterium]